MTTDVLPPNVVDALNAGNKIEAIKRLRGLTGLGLKEAKDWVDSYERGGQVPSDRFGPQGPAPSSIHARAGLGPGEVARGFGKGKWLALGALAALAVIAALYY